MDNYGYNGCGILKPYITNLYIWYINRYIHTVHGVSMWLSDQPTMKKNFPSNNCIHPHKDTHLVHMSMGAWLLGNIGW